MDGNAYSRRRPLMLCGGDIPDIMWSGDPLAVRANLRNGFIMEIPYDVILEHAPTYVAHVNTYGKEAWLYSQYKGRNYGLPTINAGANRPRISCWRLDWLKNVGLDKVPETVGEMHEALYRFRHHDPDGNDEQDTYGWTPFIGHWSLAFVEVFAAYDILAFDLMERDGTVVWGGCLPQTKEALQVLHQWYVEGLLDPDFPLNAQGRGSDRTFTNGKTGYHHPVDNQREYRLEDANSLLSKTRAFNPNAELVPGPPLRNAAGRRRGRTWGGAAHILQFGKQLEQRPEKVIRVLRMMEAIAKDETLYMQARYGERGVQWDSNAAEGIVTLPPYKDDSRKRAAELLPSTIFFFPCSLEQVYDDRYRAAHERQWLQRYKRSEWGMMNVLGKSDVVPSAGRLLGDLVTYQLTTFIEMIVGDRNVDEFDAFVTEWRRRGGDVIVEEADTMYQQMHAIYRRVGVAEGTP
ncbi:MAG: hypothetical protein HON70_32780 [Lentisphaerae bacterium]|nr:hypothetical protein [Lentisphaerota bacterium]